MPAVLSSLAHPLGEVMPVMPSFNFTDLDFAYFGNLTNLTAYTALPSVASVVERLPALPKLPADLGVHVCTAKFAVANSITAIAR